MITGSDVPHNVDMPSLQWFQSDIGPHKDSNTRVHTHTLTQELNLVLARWDVKRKVDIVCLTQASHAWFMMVRNLVWDGRCTNKYSHNIYHQMKWWFKKSFIYILINIIVFNPCSYKSVCFDVGSVFVMKKRQKQSCHLRQSVNGNSNLSMIKP